jgi:hypothetical protein
MDTEKMVKMYVTTDCLTRGIRLLTDAIVTLSDDSEYFAHTSAGVTAFHKLDLNTYFDLEVAHMAVRMKKAILVTELEAEIRRINNHDEAHKITFV